MWFVIVLVFIFEESIRKLCVDFQLNVESRNFYISVFLEQEFFFFESFTWVGNPASTRLPIGKKVTPPTGMRFKFRHFQPVRP